MSYYLHDPIPPNFDDIPDIHEEMFGDHIEQRNEENEAFRLEVEAVIGSSKELFFNKSHHEAAEIAMGIFGKVSIIVEKYKPNE